MNQETNDLKAKDRASGGTDERTNEHKGERMNESINEQINERTDECKDERMFKWASSDKQETEFALPIIKKHLECIRVVKAFTSYSGCQIMLRELASWVLRLWK